MAYVSWPSTLPQYLMASDYQEAFSTNSLETATDGGATKSRARFTRRADTFDCAMIMTPAQVAILETFYYTTLAKGTLPFAWVHPRTRAAMNFKFRTPAPKLTDWDGIDSKVGFKLERIA